MLTPPVEIAKKRNASRERKVPEYAIERMRNFLEENSPELIEGFDTLFVFNENQEMVSADIIKENGKILSKEFQIKIQ